MRTVMIFACTGTGYIRIPENKILVPLTTNVG